MDNLYAWLGAVAVVIFTCLMAAMSPRKEVEIVTDEEFLEAEKRAKEQASVIHPPVPALVVEEASPEPTKQQILYRVAKESIGRDMSPKDLAPDRLACVDSLNGVFYAAFGEYIKKGIVSTAALYALMERDPRFISVGSPEPGDIWIAVTGQSTKGAPHGHVGICGYTDVMSNDSDTGNWLANYTIAAWKLVFTKTLGFPLHAFRVVD